MTKLIHASNKQYFIAHMILQNIFQELFSFNALSSLPDLIKQKFYCIILAIIPVIKSIFHSHKFSILAVEPPAVGGHGGLKAMPLATEQFLWYFIKK